MRKGWGLLVALALLVPVGMTAAAPAGAAGGGCTKISGFVGFSPGLPIIGSKATVTPTITLSNVISGCTGSGVKSATSTVKAKSTVGLNCANAASVLAKASIGKTIEVWNTKATSTVTGTLGPVKGHTDELKLTSKVTAGLFKGTTTIATLKLAALLPAGACAKQPLAKLTFASTGKIITK